MVDASQIRRIISVHRKPVALLGAVSLALLFGVGVSLAHHSNLSFLPNVKPLTIHTTSRLLKVEQQIPFELRQESDASMNSGDQFVRSPGEMGLEEETFRVTYLNGHEVRRTLLSKKMLRAPSAQVTLVGTGVSVSDQSSSSSTNVSQNNSDISVDSTGDCSIKTRGDVGNRDITSKNGSYHFSNSSASGSSNNSISVNCHSN